MRCLPQDKPAVYDNSIVENRKHQERLPADVCDGVRRDLAHHEIEQPLGSSSGCYTNLTNSIREYLSDVPIEVSRLVPV